MRIRRRGDDAEAAAGPPSAHDANDDPASGQLPPASRAWNLWELERLAEALNGDTRSEERRLLLLHLRDVADASGHLPVEFDPLVRDAFGASLAELVT